MTTPKPQDLADYLASPAGAGDLAELQASMEESEQLLSERAKAKAASEKLAAQVRASFEESLTQVEKVARELDGKMTPTERAAQRESFAFGNANASNPEVTREMVREAIAKEDEAE